MIDDFEIKRRRLLSQLNGKKNPSLFEKKPVPAQKKNFEPAHKPDNSQLLPLVGILSRDLKTIQFVEKEGGRVANFKIFKTETGLMEWVERECPKLFVVDIDPPLEERIFMNCLSELPLISENTAVSLLTKTPRNLKVFQFTKMVAKSVLSKPIQLLDIKSILNGNIPIDCRPPIY